MGEGGSSTNRTDPHFHRAHESEGGGSKCEGYNAEDSCTSKKHDTMRFCEREVGVSVKDTMLKTPAHQKSMIL